MHNRNNSLAERCEQTWNACYPDRRKWADIGKDAQDEWMRVLGHFDAMQGIRYTALLVCFFVLLAAFVFLASFMALAYTTT